jgi:hypothetical protein
MTVSSKGRAGDHRPPASLLKRCASCRDNQSSRRARCYWYDDTAELITRTVDVCGILLWCDRTLRCLLSERYAALLSGGQLVRYVGRNRLS